MRKLMVFGIAAALSAGAFAEEEDGHVVLYGQGGGGYWSGSVWSRTPQTGTRGQWQNDAVGVVEAGNINKPQTGDLTVYRIRWQNSLSFMGAGSGRLLLGAGGLELSSNMKFNTTRGNAFHLTASQTWKSTDSTSRTVDVFNGSSYSPAGSPLVISAADDVVLTLNQSLTWKMQGQIAFEEADITVGSSGALKIPYVEQCDTRAKIRTLTIDGSTASTITLPSGEGRLQIGTLILRNGGQLSVSHSTTSAGFAVDEIADSIVADSGAGTLVGKIAGGADAVTVGAEEGAMLTLAPTWAGEPAHLKLVGAGTIAIGGSGVEPVIDSVEGFTGTLELKGPCAFADGVLDALTKVVISGPAAIAVDYPKTLDFSKFEVVSGGSATLRCVTPRPPAAYRDGIVVATGVSGSEIPTGWTVAMWNPNTGNAHRDSDISYSVDDGKLRMDPNDPCAVRIGSTPVNWFTWDDTHWKKDASDEVRCKWVDGAIATLQYGRNTTLDSDVVARGIRWTSFNSFFSGGTGVTLYLGSEGISYTVDSGIRIGTFKEIRLTDSQTWTGPGGAIYVGDNQLLRWTRFLAADKDVVWTIAGPITVCVDSPCDFSEADVVLKGEQTTGTTTFTLDCFQWGYADVALNARTLTLNGKSKANIQTDSRVDGGYTVAQKVVFGTNANGTPTLSFAAARGGATSGFDVGAIEADGTASALISGTTYFLDRVVPVTIGEGSVLTCSAAFANAKDHPGAIKLLGAGTWSVAGTERASAPIYTEESIADFEGTVSVADGAVLNVSGAVDFPSLVFEGNATVCFDLDAGSKIVDWSKVTFPAEGKKVTLFFCRKDTIAAAESPLDVGMDLSSVSADDRAKLAAKVEGQAGGWSAYSVSAVPAIAADGKLALTLTPAMGEKNTLSGGMLWIGRDWGDATDPLNWVVYPNGTEKAAFNPDAHPADLADIKAKLKSSGTEGGIYTSANWHLDLRGETFMCYDGRANNSAGARFFGVSNGTWRVCGFMVGAGRFDVESGATLIADAFSSSQQYPAYFTFGGPSVSDPFVFEVHPNATAQVGHPINYMSTTFRNVLYQVDAGGALSYYPRLKSFENKAKTVFANEGELSFPLGLALANTSAAVTGAVAVVQKSGTLHLSGEFSLSLGEGCATACGITLEGGTTVLSNDVSFAGWDLAVAEDADVALEVLKDGDFTTDGFAWGANAALTKKGAGVLRLAAADNVADAGLTLSEGLVTAADADGTAVGGLVFAGGAIGVDPEVVGNGLVVTSGAIGGTCRVRALGKFSESVPFLTVAAATDPGYTSENVIFENARGKAITGRITKETVTVGDVECVRYSAAFVPNGVILIVR